MTQQEMNILVPKKLKELERENNIKVLYAAESGSRAWGFASSDSDFDVRFIYVHPTDFYLKLEKQRDVIEMPIDDTWDVSGWDIQKALRLLHGSNPSLFEWAASPLVYHSTDIWEKQIAPVMNEYFQPQKSIHHYLSMAARTAKENLSGETIKAKKYFYILRTILAAKWVIAYSCPPPMLFEELVDDQLEAELKPLVCELIQKKCEAPELGHIPRISVLDDYIYSELVLLNDASKMFTRESNKPWETLDKLFADILVRGLFSEL